jgi:hypothetical protein
MRRPPLPYILLGAMTLVTFGGPFVILLALRRGSRPDWPPESTSEWSIILLVLALEAALVLSCLSIRLWYPVPGTSKRGRERS